MVKYIVFDVEHDGMYNIYTDIKSARKNALYNAKLLKVHNPDGAGASSVFVLTETGRVGKSVGTVLFGNTPKGVWVFNDKQGVEVGYYLNSDGSLIIR